MGVLILPPVRGASKQGGAQPHTVKGGKIELASGVADKTTALPDEPPAHLPSKRRANNLKQLNSTPFFYNCLCSFSHSGLTDILCYIGLSFLTLDLPTRSDISVEVACRQAQHSASMKKVVIRFH